jgi:hypothetical protein
MTQIRQILLVLLALCALPALAHKASDSYLQLKVNGAAVSGQWDVALRDIDFAIGLDANGDGQITWGEVRDRQTDISAWALSRLSLQRGGSCSLQVSEHLIDKHTDGAYAVMRLAGTCPTTSEALTLNYRLLFDQDDLHRGLLKLNLDGVTHAAVLSPDKPEISYESGETTRLKQFFQYVVEGIRHIWIGFDHILFLLALLLPAVLVYEAKRWQGAPTLGSALRQVVGVVTAFTLAHSITLTLASLGWVSLPSRWVESVIAASVVLAAANNLWPLVERRRWLVAFVFGLIHGFGFASVLTELGLPQGALVLSLLGFNLGVELGQLAIVAVFLPAAYLLRNTRFYRQGIFKNGSIITAVVALFWFVERAFNVRLISF